MIDKLYADKAWETTAALLQVDSPSGYTEKAAIWVRDAFANLGFDAAITQKGGVIVDLGGEDAEDALLLEAHADTLGCMVSAIKGSGRLKLTSLGGMNPNTPRRRMSGFTPAAARSLRAPASCPTPPST